MQIQEKFIGAGGFLQRRLVAGGKGDGA